jgi:predicted TIM-barrel fold metal-dependent hydrolase
MTKGGFNMLIDGHIHFTSLDVYDLLMRDLKRTGATHFNILVYEQSFGEDFKQAHGIWLKMKHPDTAYLFGGLELAGLSPTSNKPNLPLEKQVQTMIDAGFDGLKLLIGKPTSRAAHGQPLDSPTFTPMLTLLEKTRFPVLWHVADPAEFWSEHTVPLWARQNRWWYDDKVPTYQTIRNEINNVIARHPNLNIILAHFFFLSDKLDEAAKLLTEHPSYNIDLAPGVEMLHNFTANHAKSREFFIRFADQIVFGTDIGVGNNSTGPERGPMIRRFLETDDHFPVPDDPYMTPDPRPDLHGIKLPRNVLDKIYYKNFQRIAGEKPKPLHIEKVRTMLQELERAAIASGEKSSTATRVLKELFGNKA